MPELLPEGFDPTRFHDSTPRPAGQKIALLCDWLPPEFGAVGQYTLQRGEQLARDGHFVTVIGFARAEIPEENQRFGSGHLRVIRVNRAGYDKTKLVKRALWTLGANFSLLRAAKSAIKSADEIIFTGSPPYLLHFIAPLHIFRRAKLVYRITDFHPECLMAEYERVPLWLKMVYHATLFWRKCIGTFEALGEDQKARLRDIGVPEARMRLVRDPAPIAFAPELAASAKPFTEAAILYSGNFGVAHDHQTFVDGYASFIAQHPGKASLWLNAVGKKADLIETNLRSRNLPVHRSQPVPLADLPALLKAADVHLITLRDSFVGYVLPSKVYACIDSGRPVLFIGSESSDVHLLCASRMPAEKYRRVDVGDAAGVVSALVLLLA
jgi:glycosyltransferase involved in cell wall biosynthesis